MWCDVIGDVLVAHFERRRISGLRAIPRILSAFPVRVILRRLKRDRASASLLAERLRFGRVSRKAINQILVEAIKLDEPAKTIILNEAGYSLLRKVPNPTPSYLEKYFEGELTKTESIQKVQPVVRIPHYPPYNLVLNSTNVLHADFSYRKKKNHHKYEVRSGQTLELANAIGTVGSDAIQAQGKMYLDVNSWYGAVNHRLIHDSRLYAINHRRSLAIVKKNEADPVELDSCIWLGHPMLSSWGHFVLEGLLRLELLDRHPGAGSHPIVISDSVNLNFISLAEAIFPHLTFMVLKEGSTVLCRKLVTAPLRTFNPHHVFYSRYGESHALNGEPELFSALRDRVRATRPIRETNRRIFIDRELSLHRRSRNQERFRQIALANGYETIDPGRLPADSQLELFTRARRIWGQSGAGLFLSALASIGTSVLMVGSDFSHDRDGLASAIHLATGRKLDVVTGKRDFIAKGYSENLYHQDFTLSPSAWSTIERWCAKE